jgi:hypothetical protein
VGGKLLDGGGPIPTMTDLQSCFFCGTAEDVQEYAVVPPRYTDDGDPQVAVLCAQCKPKLLQVIEPLVNRLESDNGQVDSGATTQPQSQSTDGITMSTDRPASEPETAAPEPTDSGADEQTPATENTAETTPSEPGDVVPDAAQPPNYRRAMRMLSNREFPLDRTEVESLLAGAYDMENHELDTVLSYAVETGDLHEEDGQFFDGEQ